jgi:hypothetical protein
VYKGMLLTMNKMCSYPVFKEMMIKDAEIRKLQRNILV